MAQLKPKPKNKTENRMLVKASETHPMEIPQALLYCIYGQQLLTAYIEVPESVSILYLHYTYLQI